ncbi:MAG: hypothetical protein K9N51_01195 [Candidatus Pacebacteria bacterium]|nr:hypothetical protein [Candidatus Paceibacterota bacterium]
MNRPVEHYEKIPGWPKLRERYLAFWRGEVPDGRIIAHIQNPNPNRPEPDPWMLNADESVYLDPARLLQLKRWRYTGWNWYSDLFDYCIPSYGPNVFAGFAGGQPGFGADTVWHEPVIKSLDESDRIHFDEDNYYWMRHLEAVEYLSEACAGVEQLGMSDFGGPADWIATLMPVETFLIETLEKPDRMREFALRLARECNHAFDLVYTRIARRNDGTANWMPVWSDRRMGTVQDDIAINFSPEMYAEVFLPALDVMAAHTEHTVLHWHDGCSQHLDNLLRLPEIDLVQYGHDPNTPPFREQVGAMRRIQEAGKKLFISCVESEDVEFFIDHLDPHGLMMIVNTSDDAASRAMEIDVRKYTEKRLQAMSD